MATSKFICDKRRSSRLTPETRKAFTEHVLKHLETGIRYRRQKHALRQVIQMQARQMAGYVRGERSAYVAFKASW